MTAPSAGAAPSGAGASSSEDPASAAASAVGKVASGAPESAWVIVASPPSRGATEAPWSGAKAASNPGRATMGDEESHAGTPKRSPAESGRTRDNVNARRGRDNSKVTSFSRGTAAQH